MKRTKQNLRREGSDHLVSMLAWVEMMLDVDEVDRVAQLKELQAGLRRFNSTEDEPTKEGNKLVADLFQSKEFTVIGFVPNVTYIKIKDNGTPGVGARSAKGEDLTVAWLHPFSMDTVLLKHKELPVLLITNPALRHNKVMLDEVPLNREKLKAVLGLSG